METHLKLTTKSDNPSDLKLLLQHTHDEALLKNEYATRHWMKLRDEHVSLHSHLDILPHKLSHDVMVPVGSKALMRGNMVHTNEILVCLGDGWFVKRSAKEAAEICDRRIKLCDNMLKDLERERDLLSSRKQLPLEQDAFGAASREDIVEAYDEKKEAEWREQHRQKEREYRQKLSELRNKEKTTIHDEESLQKRLDELELQEELEEELTRLHAEREDVEYEDDSNEDDAETDDRSKCQAQSTSSVTRESSSRRVSFADERTLNINKDSDSDSDSNAETLRIEFKHTPGDRQAPIQTPADIYKHIQELMSKDGVPKSILKNKSVDLGSSGDARPQCMQWLYQPDSVPIINQEILEPSWNTTTQQSVEELEERPVVFGDVLEHPLEQPLPLPEPPTQTRPASRFKAARLATKR